MPTSHRHRILVTTLCLLAACHAGAQQADAGKLERVEVAGRKVALSSWFRAESPHFVVYSDAREEDVASLLDNLEKLTDWNVWTAATALNAAVVLDDQEQIGRYFTQLRRFKPSQEELESIERGLREIAEQVKRDVTVLSKLRERFDES